MPTSTHWDPYAPPLSLDGGSGVHTRPADPYPDDGAGGGSWGFADDGGSPSYPPILPSQPATPPLTADQVADMARACDRALQTGRGAPLARPFMYAGPDLPGLRRGDHVQAMHPSPTGSAVCVTDAELARLAPPASGQTRGYLVTLGLAVAGGGLGYALAPRRWRTGAALAGVGAGALAASLMWAGDSP